MTYITLRAINFILLNYYYFKKHKFVSLLNFFGSNFIWLKNELQFRVIIAFHLYMVVNFGFSTHYINQYWLLRIATYSLLNIEN